MEATENGKPKFYLVYVYENDDTDDVFTEDLIILTAIFTTKEKAKEYLIKKYYPNNEYFYPPEFSAINEYTEGDSLDKCNLTLDIDKANFTTSDRNGIYLIDNGEKKPLKARMKDGQVATFIKEWEAVIKRL